MNKVMQEVVLYSHYMPSEEISEIMRTRIENGWRVHACFERASDVFVVYEKEEE